MEAKEDSAGRGDGVAVVREVDVGGGGAPAFARARAAEAGSQSAVVVGMDEHDEGDKVTLRAEGADDGGLSLPEEFLRVSTVEAG